MTVSWNFLTFDVEEWYHANYSACANGAIPPQETDLERLVDEMIVLCDELKVSSTCFVLGQVAESKPGIVRKLHAAGHEIACHGYDHRQVSLMTRDQLVADLGRARAILEDITGTAVVGYRAPSWSVTGETCSWFYQVLEQQGFAYSSSVYPGSTFLYGIPGFVTAAHFPEIDGRRSPVLEVPCPVWEILGYRIGFSGGFYLRLFPVALVKLLMWWKNRRGEPVFLYLHPRELDPGQPRLSLPWRERFIHYHGLSRCKGKLRSILRRSSRSMHQMRELVPVVQAGGPPGTLSRNA